MKKRECDILMNISMNMRERERKQERYTHIWSKIYNI
jgi:hypothetical protein